MAIEKSLYEAPQGIAVAEEPEIQIEIEDPEAVTINADGVEIRMEKDGDTEDFNANLAEIGRAHV